LVEKTEQKNMTADKRNILTEQKTRQAYTTAGDGRLAKTSPTYVVYLVPSSSGAPATVGHISCPISKKKWLCGRQFLAQTSHVSFLISTKMWPCESQFLARAGHVSFL